MPIKDVPIPYIFMPRYISMQRDTFIRQRDIGGGYRADIKKTGTCRGRFLF